MAKDKSLQQNDSTNIEKISSGVGMITGITGGVLAAGVTNIAILSLGTPIFGPGITVSTNLTLGLYVSYQLIKTSINISENYVTPIAKNILQSSVDYFTQSKAVQQEIAHLPVKAQDENKQLPMAKEPDHLPMKIVDEKLPPSVDKEEINKPVSKPVKSSSSKKTNSEKSSTLGKKSGKSKELKKPKIESKKNSNSKNKDQDTPARG